MEPELCCCPFQSLWGAVLEKEEGWGVLTLFLLGGRCLLGTGDPQSNISRGNGMNLPTDMYTVIQKKALASHSACLLVWSRLFPPVLPSVVGITVPWYYSQALLMTSHGIFFSSLPGLGSRDILSSSLGYSHQLVNRGCVCNRHSKMETEPIKSFKMEAWKITVHYFPSSKYKMHN